MLWSGIQGAESNRRPESNRRAFRSHLYEELVPVGSPTPLDPETVTAQLGSSLTRLPDGGFAALWFVGDDPDAQRGRLARFDAEGNLRLPAEMVAPGCQLDFLSDCDRPVLDAPPPAVYLRGVELAHVRDLFPQLDVDATFATYEREQRDSDVARYVAWLREHGHIDRMGLVSAYATGTLEITSAADTMRAIAPKGAIRPGQADAPQLDLPLTPARYDVLASLGGGAMGTVHAAKDLTLQRNVALKRARSQDPAALARFVAEAQVNAQLDHPNVVPIYGLEVDDQGDVGYAMKLVDGRSLEEIVDSARALGDPTAALAALADRLEAFVKVCDAIAFAHSKGVIHRDLKPANVMVGRFGAVYVVDWGIAKVTGFPDETSAEPSDDRTTRAQTTGDFTQAGLTIGSPAYMSPEQARGERDTITALSDVYALGLLLYELVLLERALGDVDDARKTLERAQRAELQPFDTTSPVLEPTTELLAIISRATQPQPDDRYPSAQALADDVRRYLRGDETTALPDTRPRALRRWLVQHPRAAGLAVFGLVLVCLLALAWSRYEAAASDLAAQTRQQRLGDRVSRVGERAQRLANHFLWHEGVTASIASAATYALQHGHPAASALYHDSDFADPARAPRGSIRATRYREAINPHWPMWVAAPDVPPDLARADAQRLNALRFLMQDAFATGPDLPTPPTTEAERITRLQSHAVAMEWTYLGVERSGLLVIFPGARGSGGPTYDPRTRPWFSQAKAAWEAGLRGRCRWTRPFLDLMGQGVVIACLQPLEDDSGRFLGVSAIDLTFDYVLEHHMQMTDEPGFRAAYLVDDENQIVLATNASVEDIRATAKQNPDNEVRMGPFPDPVVSDSVRAGRSGHHVRDDGSLAIWVRLHHLHWSYVAVFGP